MHTQNVKTAAPESSERWGMKIISHIFERACYNVACMEVAHAHYGDKFTRRDECVYFVYGAMEALGSLTGNSLKKGDNDE